MLLAEDYIKNLNEETKRVYREEVNPKIKARNILGLLEHVFLELTKDELRTFSSLQARAFFVFHREEAKAIVHHFTTFQRIYKECIYGRPIQADILCLIKGLVGIVEYFGEDDFDDEVHRLIVNLEYPLYKKISHGYVDKMKLLVLEVSEIIDNGHQKYCEITAESSEGEDILLLLKDFSSAGVQGRGQVVSRKFHLLGNIIKPYQILNCFGLECLRDNLYSVTPASKVVLEPDFLLDISSLASCFIWDMNLRRTKADLNLFLVSLFQSSELTFPMLRGSMINELLDSYLEEDSLDLDKFLDGFLRSNPFSLLMGVDNLEEALKKEALRHLGAMYDFKQSKSSEEILLEPTFYSADYGLQGRLDIMTSNKWDKKRNIYELKSGRPPKDEQQVWDSHRMQVIGYHLLLESTFGKDLLGDSAVLYTQDRQYPIRNVYSAGSSEQQLLMVRNYILSFILAMSQSDFKALDRVKVSESYPEFLRRDITQFVEVYNRLSDLERSYFQHFTSFVLREWTAGKFGDSQNGRGLSKGFASLWKESPAEKERNYSLISSLSIREIEQNIITLHRETGEVELGNFRENDIIIIYPTEKEEQPLTAQLIRGTLEQVGKDFLKVKVWNRMIPSSVFDEFKYWNIEHDFFDRNHVSLLKSLFMFSCASADKKDLFFGKREPHFSSLEWEPIAGISKKQNEIVQRAVSAEDYFLIQGPPGTGKTSTILKNIIIKEYQLKPQSTLVILAFTNRSVEEICEKLDETKLSYLLLGRKDSPNSLKEKSKYLALNDIRKLIAQNRIFVSTVAGFLNAFSQIRQLKSLDTLIVDEASQLLEPHLIGLVSQFNKTIMVGDHKQLPAVVVQNADRCKQEEDILKSIGVDDLRQPLFERLFKICEQQGWNQATAMLSEHYRMHNDIASLINDYYQGKLISSSERQFTKGNFPGKSKFAELLRKHRIIYWVSPKEKLERVRHQAEAKRVIMLLNELKSIYGESFSSNSVGVITPFRAQIALIKSMLGDQELLDKVTIDTVERFQGSQREIIIYSCAIYQQSQVGMIASRSADQSVDRKLNVVISRAREALIILGDYSALTADRHYAKLLTKVKERFLYVKKNDNLLEI